MADYVCQISTDFPGGVCDENNFSVEIQASSIVTALVSMARSGDALTVTFASALSGAEKTTFDGDTSNPAGGLIAAHNPVRLPELSRTVQIKTTATLSADKNNFGGPESAGYGMFRVSSSLAVNITGLGQGVEGRVVSFHNVGAFTITLKNESASSAAVSRFSLSMDLALAPSECVTFQYDAESQRWRVLQIFPAMLGDAGSGGRKGMVPAPASGDATKFLRGDGTWVTVVLAQAVSTPNVIDDSLAQPPTIAGTVSITNGSATVTGTSTAFTTALAVGMVIRFNAQTGTNYTILSIASNTSLTLAANYSGTTNASTTLRGIRESDAYIVGASPAGDWAAFANGDLVVWTGSAWTKLLTGTGSAPAANTTVLVTAFQGTAAGAFAGQSGKIAVYSGGAWAFTAPTTDHQITVVGLGDPLEGATALYRLTSATWAITAPGFRLVTLTGSNTTTSTSDTVTGMGIQLVPAAGVYEVEFFGGAANSGTGATATCIMTPYAAGAALTTAISRVKSTAATSGGTNISGFYGAATGVVLNGLQNVEGRWKVGANTGTRYEVAIKIRRIR
jgi:hypothetical protein